MHSISCVILPGLGSVCPECFSRGYVAAMPFRIRETYSFCLTEPISQLDWDVDAARELIAARPRAAMRLDLEWIEHWLRLRTTITPQHLDHLPADRVEEPGLIVEIVTCPPGGEPEPFRILIDGSHRAARRLREGRQVWVYLLTESEQRSVCTYRREGRIVEIPTLPGPGVTDEQAGIGLDRSGASEHA